MAAPYESVSVIEIGVFLTSLLVALFTAIATWVNYRLFRTQVDPEVIVYLTPDDNQPSIILMVIENTGKGLAKNITFSLSQPVPRRAYGLSSEKASEAQLMTHGPLIHGIPSLGPGAKRIIQWGQFGGLKKALGGNYVYVKAIYKGSGQLSLFEKSIYETESVLEITSFEGTADRQNWHKKIADNLDALTKAIKTKP